MDLLFSRQVVFNYVILLPIESLLGTNPDTIGVSGTIKFHSPFVFSVAVGSQGTDEAPTITVTNGGTALTADNTTLIVVPDTTGTTVTPAKWRMHPV